MWDNIVKIAECIVALTGLILGFKSVLLSRLSFKEAALAREDIAKFSFRQKQEQIVAKLVQYLNVQNIGFYDSYRELFKGNIWALSETHKLDIYKEYDIQRFIGNFSILKVDKFIFNVYLPKGISVILKDFQVKQSAQKPKYGDKVLQIRTSFHFVDEFDYNIESDQDDYFYLDEHVCTIAKIIKASTLLRESVEKWYHENGIDGKCNIIPIDNTGNGPSIIGISREN